MEAHQVKVYFAKKGYRWYYVVSGDKAYFVMRHDNGIWGHHVVRESHLFEIPRVFAEAKCRRVIRSVIAKLTELRLAR